jgi:hypothetical protein
MKITKQQLKQIIKEELKNILNETNNPLPPELLDDLREVTASHEAANELGGYDLSLDELGMPTAEKERTYYDEEGTPLKFGGYVGPVEQLPPNASIVTDEEDQAQMSLPKPTMNRLPPEELKTLPTPEEEAAGMSLPDRGASRGTRHGHHVPIRLLKMLIQRGLLEEKAKKNDEYGTSIDPEIAAGPSAVGAQTITFTDKDVEEHPGAHVITTKLPTSKKLKKKKQPSPKLRQRKRKEPSERAT